MNALMISYYNYPEGDAGAVRQHNLAKIYRSLGYDVCLVAMGHCQFNQMQQFDEFNYLSFRNPNDKRHQHLTRFNHYFDNFIKNYSKKIDLIHLSTLPINILIHIKKYAIKHNIKIINDSVEWYSASQFSKKIFAPAYVEKELVNRWVLDKHTKIISISSYLENYFKQKHIHTVRIPIVFSKNDMRENNSINEKIKVVYAGSPGKKDYIHEIFSALNCLDIKKADKMLFEFYGVSNKDLDDICHENHLDKTHLEKFVTCRGRVSRRKVVEAINKADFTIMLRDPNQRYAKAGFPTKVVESLVNGTPMITNLSSDLGEYLVDGKNSLIVDSFHHEDLIKILDKMVQLNQQQLLEMKKHSYKTAVEQFDLMLYRGKLETLINM